MILDSENFATETELVIMINVTISEGNTGVYIYISWCQLSAVTAWQKTIRNLHRPKNTQTSNNNFVVNRQGLDRVL